MYTNKLCTDIYISKHMYTCKHKLCECTIIYKMYSIYIQSQTCDIHTFIRRYDTYIDIPTFLFTDFFYKTLHIQEVQMTFEHFLK